MSVIIQPIHVALKTQYSKLYSFSHKLALKIQRLALNVFSSLKNMISFPTWKWHVIDHMIVSLTSSSFAKKYLQVSSYIKDAIYSIQSKRQELQISSLKEEISDYKKQLKFLRDHLDETIQDKDRYFNERLWAFKEMATMTGESVESVRAYLEAKHQLESLKTSNICLKEELAQLKQENLMLKSTESIYERWHESYDRLSSLIRKFQKGSINRQLATKLIEDYLPEAKSQLQMHHETLSEILKIAPEGMLGKELITEAQSIIKAQGYFFDQMVDLVTCSLKLPLEAQEVTMTSSGISEDLATALSQLQGVLNVERLANEGDL
jgi:hypothetical protein